MPGSVVTVFGGSGFLGRYVVNLLCKHGYRVKIVSLNPINGQYLKPCGTVGQVNIIYGNVRKIDSVRHAIAGADIVINLVGILHASGSDGFSNIHAKGAENIAKTCAEFNVKRLIHISALGVDKPSGSLYARSKLNGEKAVLNAYPTATILRPGLIFGAEDNFFNLFERISRYLPILPLIGGGETKFQPVYVEDVAKAVYHALLQDKSKGKIYELGGDKIYSFKALISYILTLTHRKRILLPLPFALASIIGFFAKFLPTPIITSDQVKLLKIDNTISPSMPGLHDLGIEATSLEAVVPTYL